MRKKWFQMMKNLCVFVLLIALTVSMLPAGAVYAAGETQDSETEQAVIIDVTDYGADPSGRTDSVVPIRKAIEAAKKVEGPVVLNFPTGEYNLWPDDATVRRIYISNSTTPSETDYEENSIRTIGILLENLKDVTVEGNGSELIYHGKMMSFAMIGCENVKIQNLSYDFATHYVVDITVESVTENTADVYIPDSYDYEINGNKITFYGEISPKTGDRYWSRPDYPYGQINEMLTGEIYRVGSGAGAVFNNCTSIEEIGNKRVRFHYSQKPSAKPGYNMQIKEVTRDNPSMLLWESENIQITNIEARHLHSFGIVGQFSKDITIDNLKVIADERKGVLTAAAADCIQMSGCGGKVTIKNSEFRNPQDDPINIHGTFLQIEDVLAPNKVTVRYMERETYGFPNYYVGDEVEFISRLNLNAVGTEENKNAVVTEVENPEEEDYSKENRKRITLTFDRDLPEEILNGTYSNYVVENITYTPEVEIANCIFDQSPVRGILCTTRKKVLIENCVFRNINMSCIYISDDANGWYESGYFRDVTIRNNLFEGCNSAAIDIGPVVWQPDKDHPLHQNLRIEGNTFRLKDKKAVQIKSVENVTIKNNRICSMEENAEAALEVAESSLKNGESANFNLEIATPMHSTGLFSAEYSKNIQIAGNEYGPGLNRMIATFNMDENEVTISEDEALRNTANKDTDYLENSTVRYFVSKENVIQVDEKSKSIYALAEGETSLYAVVTTADGKEWESNRVAVSVTELEPEKTVTVESDVDVITQEGGQAVLTATQNGSPIDASWSVKDPATGKDSSVAVIDDGGRLTAKGNGVVEVIATAADGYKGRKLIRIRVEKLERTAQIIKEVAGHLTLNDENSMTQQVSTRSGFFDPRNQEESLITFPIADGATFEATVKLTGGMKNTYEETGFGILKDVDNFVAVQKKNHLGTILVTESNASGSEGIRVGDKLDVAYYKIVKQGNVFEGYYKANETDEWIRIGQTTNTTVGNDGLVLAMWAASATAERPNQIVWSDLVINGVKQPFGYINKAPSAEHAALHVNTLETGELLTAEYEYADPNGDTEGSSVVLWYSAEEEAGPYTRINGAAGKQLTLVRAYEGKYIRAEVIPADSAGLPGEGAVTEPVGPIARGTESGGAESGDGRVSANAWLAGLDAGGLTLSSEFAYPVMNYMAGVDAGTEQLLLTADAQAEDAKIKIMVNGQTVAEQTGRAAREITLLSGFNRILVDVTAPDGVTARQYKLIVLRNGYTDTSLADVKVNGVSLEGFSPEKKEYEILAEEASEITLEASAVNDRASVRIADGSHAVQNGVLSAETTAGSNLFVIAVTSESKGAKDYYTVRVKVKKEDNANLEKAELENVMLEDSFVPGQTSYRGETAENAVSFHFTAEEPGAALAVYGNRKSYASEDGEITGSMPVYLGENKLLVTVKAPDGTKKTYTFTIVGKDSVYLSDLRWKEASSGWDGHPAQKDKNVLKGILALNIDGVTTEFAKGIGTHADSTIVYNIAGKGYTGFASWVGVDASREGRGAVSFRILVDGVQRYDSGVLTSADNAQYVELDITGAETLTLIADKGDVNWDDHADYADAKFITGLTGNQEQVKIGLDRLILLMEDLDASAYTPDSWLELEEALEAARNVQADANATQPQVDEAVSLLLRAFGGLEDSAQKLHLETAILAAEAILAQAKDYEEDARALQAAVEEGKTVLADRTADQEQVNLAAWEVLDELARLARKADLISLESMVDAAKKLLNGNYTESSLEALEAAIGEAQKVIDDHNRGDNAISDAYTALIQALIHLEMKGSKAALQAMIIKAEEILAHQDAYAPSTIEGLQEVLDGAKAVYEDDQAVQAAIDQAVRELTEKAAQARLLGDVDGDGKVGTSDSAALLRSAAELESLDDAAAESADVNRDGTADTTDAALILQYAAEKISGF